MKTLTFKIVIEKEPEDEGYYAYVPALPGCFSNGKTVEEARTHIGTAIKLHLEALTARGEQIPATQPSIQIEDISVISPI